MESNPKTTTVSDDYYFEEVLSRDSNDNTDYGIDPDFINEDEVYVDIFDQIDEEESEFDEDDE